MYHVLSHEGNDEAGTCQTQHLRSPTPPLQHLLVPSMPSSPLTITAMVALPTRSPLLPRHFPAGEKKGTYRLLGQAVLSPHGAVRKSTL